MNRSELRTALRSFLNEDIPGFWTDAQLNTYINLANDRVNSIISATREDYFTISATFSTVAGTKSYSFPTDCRFIRRMEIFDASNEGYIIKLDELRWPRIEANGDWLFPNAPAQPKRYVTRGNQFDLYPTPDGAYTIRIYYDARPVTLDSDVDIPTSPSDFHDMIVYWAAMLAKKQNEEDDAGYSELFNARKVELIQTLINRGGEDATTVEAYLEGII
jgi:hypothetical protein